MHAALENPGSAIIRLSHIVPDGLHEAIRRVLHSKLRCLEHGSLTIVDGGREESFGRPGTGPDVRVVVHDPAAYSAVALGGSVGAGLAYVRAQWSTPDLAALSHLMCLNLDTLSSIEGGTAAIANLWNRAASLASPNTRRGSRRNVAHHYDVSPEFFELFLDRSMTYSCAIFSSARASLDDAQEAKIDRVCQKLDLRPGDRVLEIGTGWGALARHIAGRYGCRVTTTTISREQWRYAKKRAAEDGLGERIEFLLRDYRDVVGTYDKVVSIEMIEAIGHEQLGAFFRACSERLRPGGTMLVQAITIRDRDEKRHRGSADFIKRFIYPGSSIPSVETLVSAAASASDLRLYHLEDMTPHYALTLREWRSRLRRNTAAARVLGADEAALRMWDYYFAYCEGGFTSRYLGSVSMIFAKPGACPNAIEGGVPNVERSSGGFGASP